jgi:hypothetical protein
MKPNPTPGETFSGATSRPAALPDGKEFPAPSARTVADGEFKLSITSEPAQPEPSSRGRGGITRWIVAFVAVVIALPAAYLALHLLKQPSSRAEQPLSLSESSARAEEENKRLELRSWVGVTEIDPQPLTATGSAFKITLQNSGKTPALIVHVAEGVQVDGSTPIGASKDAPATVQRTVGTLFPGGIYRDTLEYRLPMSAVAALYRNQTYAVVHISITYKDVFQAFHTTQSCFYWQPTLPAVQACEHDNAVN